jgi:hypothetical protein
MNVENGTILLIETPTTKLITNKMRLFPVVAILVSSICVTGAQRWTWIGGTSVPSIDPAFIPQPGVPSNTTWPRPRYLAVGWTPYPGSSDFFLYGGKTLGYNPDLIYADIWKFNAPTSGNFS